MKKRKGRKLKKEFSEFYSKNSVDLKYKDTCWKTILLKLNDLTEELVFKNKKEDKEAEDYVSEFTKLDIIKGSKSYKILNENISCVTLSPLYGK